MTDQSICPLCEGTGFKMVAGEDARGRKIQKATRCDCQLRARGERLVAQARIPARYEHCELANFDTEFNGEHHPSLAGAKLAAGRLVEEYPIDRIGLMLIGPVGVGKTHLAVGIVRELMLQKGIASLFYDYRELLKEIQNSFNPSVQATEMGILRTIFETEVLVLDELGAVRPTEWVWDTVNHILNTRYNDKKTTIITTNFRNAAAREREEEITNRRFSDPEKATRNDTLGDRVGERMRSRLNEMCRIVDIEGDDFRLKYRNAANRRRF